MSSKRHHKKFEGGIGQTGHHQKRMRAADDTRIHLRMIRIEETTIAVI
jgi:hypothetical protein